MELVWTVSRILQRSVFTRPPLQSTINLNDPAVLVWLKALPLRSSLGKLGLCLDPNGSLRNTNLRRKTESGGAIILSTSPTLAKIATDHSLEPDIPDIPFFPDFDPDRCFVAKLQTTCSWFFVEARFSSFLYILFEPP